ncbi:MAG: NAD-binding protein [Chloroflexota bacterium]|nr:NAD-binding protein [Chloroflexota bacterium]
MNIIIVGAGNIGSLLAQTISNLGHKVTIIEKNFKAASSLPRGRVNSGVLKVIHSDGSTASAMIEADVANAEVFIAATGKDSLNGLTAQKAKTIFGVEQVMTVVKDPDAKNLYDSLGITTINQAALASNQLAKFLTQES